MRDIHANFVLQKCITTLPAEHLQFVVDELSGDDVVRAARHRIGCRTIQRLLERCPPHQVQKIVETIISNLPAISCDPYGNYVVQNLLENSTAEQQHRIADILGKGIRTFVSDSFACAVVTATMSHGSHINQLLVARALLTEPDILVYMACTKHGHKGVIRLLHLLEGEERKDAWCRLSAETESLCASKFGSVVADLL